MTVSWMRAVALYVLIVPAQTASPTAKGTEIEVVPEKLKVEDHGQASLYCSTTAPGDPNINWRRNGRRISTGGNYEIYSTWGGSILRINPVRFKRDDALFECVMAPDDQEGEPISAAAHIMVYPKWLRPKGYPRIVDSDSMRLVGEYDLVILLCVVEGDPKPNVTWIKDYVPVDTDYRHKIVDKGSLEIAYVSDDDEGIYECTAENDLGIAYSPPARIIMEDSK